MRFSVLSILTIFALSMTSVYSDAPILTPPTSPEEYRERINSFLEWFDGPAGGVRSATIDYFGPVFGQGIAASKSVSEGDTLIKIPLRSVVCESTINSFVGNLEKRNRSVWNYLSQGRDYVTIWLMFHRGVNSICELLSSSPKPSHITSEDLSVFRSLVPPALSSRCEKYNTTFNSYPYFNVLPRTVPSPVVWPLEDLKLLEDDSLLREALRTRSELISQYNFLIPAIRDVFKGEEVSLPLMNAAFLALEGKVPLSVAMQLLASNQLHGQALPAGYLPEFFTQEDLSSELLDSSFPKSSDFTPFQDLITGLLGPSSPSSVVVSPDGSVDAGDKATVGLSGFGSSHGSLQSFVWATLVLGSRALTLRGQRFLVPFADMANFEPSANALSRVADDGQNFLRYHRVESAESGESDEEGLPAVHERFFRVRTDRDSVAGEQIFEDYGDSDSAVYLMHHGMLPLVDLENQPVHPYTHYSSPYSHLGFANSNPMDCMGSLLGPRGAPLSLSTSSTSSSQANSTRTVHSQSLWLEMSAEALESIEDKERAAAGLPSLATAISRARSSILSKGKDKSKDEGDETGDNRGEYVPASLAWRRHALVSMLGLSQRRVARICVRPLRSYHELVSAAASDNESTQLDPSLDPVPLELHRWLAVASLSLAHLAAPACQRSLAVYAQALFELRLEHAGASAAHSQSHVPRPNGVDELTLSPAQLQDLLVCVGELVPAPAPSHPPHSASNEAEARLAAFAALRARESESPAVPPLLLRVQRRARVLRLVSERLAAFSGPIEADANALRFLTKAPQQFSEGTQESEELRQTAQTLSLSPVELRTRLADPAQRERLWLALVYRFTAKEQLLTLQKLYTDEPLGQARPAGSTSAPAASTEQDDPLHDLVSLTKTSTHSVELGGLWLRPRDAAVFLPPESLETAENIASQLNAWVKDKIDTYNAAHHLETVTSDTPEKLGAIGVPVTHIEAAAVGNGMRLGAIAATPVAHEEVYLSLPPTAIMDSASARACPLLGPLLQELISAANSDPSTTAHTVRKDAATPARKSIAEDEFAVLLLHLLVESRLLRPLNMSYFGSYIDSLPSTDEQPFPLFYAERERSLLQGSRAVAGLRSYESSLQQKLRRLREELHPKLPLLEERLLQLYSKKQPALAPPSRTAVHNAVDSLLSDEWLLWGAAVLDSRAIWWENKRHLVPLLDLINCAVGPRPARVHATRTGFVGAPAAAVTLADRDYARGDQIFESYGQPNWVFFTFHGFSLLQNPQDCVRVDMGMPSWLDAVFRGSKDAVEDPDRSVARADVANGFFQSSLHLRNIYINKGLLAGPLVEAVLQNPSRIRLAELAAIAKPVMVHSSVSQNAESLWVKKEKQFSDFLGANSGDSVVLSQPVGDSTNDFVELISLEALLERQYNRGASRTPRERWAMIRPVLSFETGLGELCLPSVSILSTLDAPGSKDAPAHARAGLSELRDGLSAVDFMMGAYGLNRAGARLLTVAAARKNLKGYKFGLALEVRALLWDAAAQAALGLQEQRDAASFALALLAHVSDSPDYFHRHSNLTSDPSLSSHEADRLPTGRVGRGGGVISLFGLTSEERAHFQWLPTSSSNCGGHNATRCRINSLTYFSDQLGPETVRNISIILDHEGESYFDTSSGAGAPLFTSVSTDLFDRLLLHVLRDESLQSALAMVLPPRVRSSLLFLVTEKVNLHQLGLLDSRGLMSIYSPFLGNCGGNSRENTILCLEYL